MNKEIICFSDDITGALDVAGSFHSRGYKASVQTEQDYLTDTQTICQVRSLNSRYNNTLESSVKLSEALQKVFEEANNPRLFLKVDSTLRGNIFDDVATVEDFNQGGPVFIAPAFPYYGRTCINGVYFVRGQPIKETEFALDRAFYRNSSYLSDNRSDIEHIDWRVLDTGVEAILKKIELSKKRKFTFDTRDQADLELVADAGLLIDALMVGSSGLARAFPKEKPSVDEEVFLIDNLRPTLFVIGSTHDAARKQKEELLKSGITGIELLPSNIGNTQILQNLKEKIQEWLEQGRTVYIATPDEVTRDAWQEFEDSIAEVSAVPDVRHNLVVVGGETTLATLKGRGIKTLLIRSEYEAGMPVSSEPNKSDTLITKAGGFGHPNTLVDIYRFINR